MRSDCRLTVQIVALLTTVPVSARADTAGPVVWNGPPITFSKEPFAAPEDPANQDVVTENVNLTRGSSSGMFNIAQELFSQGVDSPSPVDTEWATPIIGDNSDQAITAANWESLDFTNWSAAYGGAGLLAETITELPAVVHLITDDIYLDLQFTDWGQGFGGGGRFTYVRSTPVPEPATLVLVLTAMLASCGISANTRRWRVCHPCRSDCYWATRFSNTMPRSLIWLCSVLREMPSS